MGLWAATYLSHYGVRIQKMTVIDFMRIKLIDTLAVIQPRNLQAKSQRFTIMDQILSFSNFQKNSRHSKISTNSALLTFLLWDLASKRVGDIYSDQKLTLKMMLTCVLTTKFFF